MSKAFGEHLRILRKQQTRYTQQDMADMLKISRSTYTYYETGKSEPGQDALGKICEILNVDYNTLLDVSSSSLNDESVASDIDGNIDVLSPEEEHIIHAYRRMTDDDKDFFHRQLSSIVKRTNKI